MEIIENYLKCAVKLIQTDYSDTKAPLIIKTHNYRGEKTEVFYCKKKGDITWINKNMFKPFHIQILQMDSDKVIGDTKLGNISDMFLENFIAKYNKAEVLTQVEVLFNVTNFTTILKDDKLQIRVSKYYYSRKEMEEIVGKLTNFVYQRNKNKSLSNVNSIRMSYDTWLEKDLETFIKEEIDYLL